MNSRALRYLVEDGGDDVAGVVDIEEGEGGVLVEGLAEHQRAVGFDRGLEEGGQVLEVESHIHCTTTKVGHINMLDDSIDKENQYVMYQMTGQGRSPCGEF